MTTVRELTTPVVCCPSGHKLTPKMVSGIPDWLCDGKYDPNNCKSRVSSTYFQRPSLALNFTERRDNSNTCAVHMHCANCRFDLCLDCYNSKAPSDKKLNVEQFTNHGLEKMIGAAMQPGHN